MMSKTHFAIGLATSLAIIRPQTFNECAVAVIGGALGGVLADNDILDNDYQDDALIGQILALGTVVLTLLIDFFFKLGICQSIISTPILSIIGGIGFVVLYIIGFNSDHRTFTHSFLALALYTIAIAFIHIPLVIPFASAYLSHLMLDVLNKKKVPLLYPLEAGICLKLCYASKTANTVFMYIGFGISAILITIGIITSCIN